MITKQLKHLLLAFVGSFITQGICAIEPVDGIYQIGSSQDLKEFANIVNKDGRQHQFHAVVTQDFTVDGLVMVGAPSNAFAGSFDGQGHTITIHFEQQASGGDGECALFRRINGCTVKNLRVDGVINTKGQFAGGIISGIWQKAVVENCVSTVVINDENSGDGTHGGIVARISDKSDIVIRNCAFLGTINASGRWGSGGILGWPDNGGAAVKIQGCLMAGTLNLATGQDNDVIVRNSATVTDCYYADLQSMNNQQNATAVADGQLASGELCYLLNGRQSTTATWFQVIGTDAMPLPFPKEGAVVYANGTLNCDGTPKAGSVVTYSNTDGAVRDEHQWNEWGFCTACNELQPDFLAEVDGAYEIATKQHYNWFMTFVNKKGNVRANARLTQNLDLSDYTFVPIGTDASRYAGTFDGQGYRILNMTLNGTVKEQAFFSVLQGGAVIKNLIIDSSCKMEGTGGSNVAALVACINGNEYGDTITIQNVGNEMSFNVSTTNNAGFVARDWSSNLKLIISNCYNTGTIMGGIENGAFTAWTPRVTLNNCWNTGRIEKTGNYDGSKSLARGNQPKFINSYDLNTLNTDNAGAPEGYEEAWMTNGRLCYIMNGNQSESVAWYQKIGEDAQPLPFQKEGGVVYANGSLKCDGITPIEGSVVSFSNTEGSTIADHSFDGGICTVCDKLDKDYLQPAADGAYELGSAKALRWFAYVVNSSENRAINARLTADVDFTPYQVMIGNGDNSDAYAGIFDGQGYKVTLGYVADQKNVALFRYLNKAVVRNLITDGTIQNENSSCAGGIFAGSRGATRIENCVSYVTFNRESAGDATVGGIGAYMHDNGTIHNCAFLGTINTPAATGNGGMLGYANGGENVIIDSCLVNPVEFNVSGNSMAVARNTGKLTNTYVVNRGSASEQGLVATAEQLASGELCYLLNGKVNGGTQWYQLIGTDAAPLPFAKEGAVIFANGSLKCDGTLKGDVTFSNTKSDMAKDDHSYTDGICVVCGTPNETFIQPDGEGVYALATAKEVVWFAAMVKNVNAAINGALSDDIDFTDIDFMGIGTADAPYSGTFDGQQHKVSNLIIDLQAAESTAGFFNEATAGAHIKNFTIDNTCYIVANHYVGAFIGHVSGNGQMVLEQLGNEAEVSAWNQNAGGIVGCNTSGSLKLTLTNCYNTGAITSERESGGISGWLGNNAVLTNCYNMGDIAGENSESFARGNNIQITNCFDPVSDWANTSLLTPIADFTNNVVYAKLDEAAPGVWFLSASENGHPVLYNTGITSSVSDIVRAKHNGTTIYDLQGRKLNGQLKKGLYIVNGRVAVVR
jgi:hypothetical protein